MYDSVKWYGHQIPIAVYSDNQILTYKNNWLYMMDSKGAFVKKSRIPSAFSDGIKELFRFSQRIFRKDIRCACISQKEEVYFFKDKWLYCYNRDNNQLKRLFRTPEEKSTPLNMIAANNEPDYSVLWGEYFSNNNRDEVNILGLNKSSSVEIVYQFPKKTVRHIHNIIEDSYNGGYYIFTGDNDEKAGIYHADYGLKNVYPVFTGQQKARAVQGFPTTYGIIYATDSVTEQNYICALTRSKNWELHMLAPINGSCIYATRLQNRFIFATTVEPPEIDNHNRVMAMLSKQRGTGILTDDVELITVNKKLEVNTIFKMKKDCLPYKLFQYGAVNFPATHGNLEYLVFYPVAVQKRDGVMGILRDF